MEPRLTLITLGFDDLPAARAFYKAMGFRESAASTPDVAFLSANGPVLALWSRAALAADAGVHSAGEGFTGIALAHNVRTESEVAEVLARAAGAGGRIVKPAQRAFWGGFSGYFADPEGHLWEVAHNPGMPLDANGHLQIPPPA